MKKTQTKSVSVLAGFLIFIFINCSAADEKINDWIKGYTSANPSDKIDRSKDDLVGFGSWSNVEVSESEDPHGLGTEIEMWKHNGELVGFMYVFVGPLADPPTGKLEDIQFDEKTGTISFWAKLATGSVYSDKEQKWVPSKDIFLFNGVIQPTSMVGDLVKKRVQDNGEEKIYETKKVKLKGGRRSDSYWENKPYQEWVDFCDRIMKSRGPKW